MATKLEIAYLAGLVDGEGCITLQKIRLWNRQHTKWAWRYKLVLVIAMCAKPTILWAQKRFGGKVYPRGIGSMRHLGNNARQQWTWIVAERKAAEVIKLIAPYLVNKKPEARCALQYRKTVPGIGIRMPKGLRARQQRFKERLTELKHVEYRVGD